MAKFEVRVRIGRSDGLTERFVDTSLEGAEGQAREWLAQLGYTEAEVQDVCRSFIDECGGKFRIDLDGSAVMTPTPRSLVATLLSADA